MYADDLVLISKTKHGLHLGVNALEFCSANTLALNTNKSEVMNVSKRNPASLPVIHYNNMPLRSYVDSFRYLGVNIHRTNNLSKGLKLTCHQQRKFNQLYIYILFRKIY